MGPIASSGPRLRARQRGFWNFVIPALATLAGSVIGGKLSQKGQESANETNLASAREAMEFSERMSSTSYQRGVEDMKAAGLNPMLAYSQGGASAPQGQQAQVQNTQAQLGTNIASSAGQAAQLMGAYQQAQATQANVDLTKATTAKTTSETLSNELHSAKLAQEIANLKASEKYTGELGHKARTDADKTAQEILGAIVDSARKHSEFEAMSKGGGFAADVERRKSQAENARLESQLRRYGLAEAKTTSDFYTGVGQMPKWLQMIMQTMRGGASVFKPSSVTNIYRK